MFRLLLAGVVGIVAGSQANAQCGSFVRTYPLNPSQFWGTPAPKPLPPLPFVPKKGVGVREEESPPPKPMDKPKSKELDSKEKSPPRIPKVSLPLPEDPDDPVVRKNPAKSEPTTDTVKAVEQFIIPAESRAERPAIVKVGFFNHSERDIDLVVDGEAVSLPKEQYVTLRLKRTFVWAEKGKKSTDVAVPPDADGMEIVFRK